MICKCGLFKKKRTLLDGIKSVSGILMVFKIRHGNENRLYLNRCCFMSLVVPLYTFVDLNWMLASDMIVFDPNTIQVDLEDVKNFGTNIVIDHAVQIKESTVQRLQGFGKEDLQIIYISSARLMAPEYCRIIEVLSMAHKKAITLEQHINDIRFKYTAALYDKQRLVLNSQVELVDLDSSEEKQLSCDKCSKINELKRTLKELKKTTHDEVNKARFELESNFQLIASLRKENAKLKDDNVKLKEVNKSLFMNR